MNSPPPLEVLHDDGRLLVVRKPPGLLVHRSREAPDRDVLLQRLAGQVGRYLYPLHRLDRSTSGAVAFACDPEAARRYQEALTDAGARKEYLVLVRGRTGDAFWVRRPLTGPRGDRQPAWTEFEKVLELARSTLLRARLRTGRRHQIRRHLAHCAHHVLGDTRYGKGRINRALREQGLARQFLHAALLELEDPWTGARVRVECSLQDDLRRFLLALPGAEPGAVAAL